MTHPTRSTHRSRLALSLLAAAMAVGLAGVTSADPTVASFDDANRAFAQGHYAEAAAGFEDLARRRGWSAPLLYDLANAYAQEGSVGRAVLNYERARLLAPRDGEIAANLSLVRAGAGLLAPGRPWYQAFARLLSPTVWTALAASGFWLACLAFAVARRRRSPRFVSLAGLAALTGMISVAAVAVLDRDLDDAVVVVKHVPLRLSPFDTAAVEATVGEGEEVAVVGRHGDFVRVRDGQGRAGWVEAAAVQLIVPRSS